MRRRWRKINIFAVSRDDVRFRFHDRTPRHCTIINIDAHLSYIMKCSRVSGLEFFINFTLTSKREESSEISSFWFQQAKFG